MIINLQKDWRTAEYGKINYLYKKIVKQSSQKYTQKEIEDAVRGHVLRFNKWIDEVSKEHKVELKQILKELIK